MKKKLAIIGVILLAAGCEYTPPTPEKTESTSNPTIPIERLFSHDGCAVYSFYDRGNYHYYTRCDSGSVETTARQSRACGKARCHYDEVIPTESETF